MYRFPCPFFFAHFLGFFLPGIVVVGLNGLRLDLLRLTPLRVPGPIIVPDTNILCRFLLQPLDHSTGLALLDHLGLDDVLERLVSGTLDLDLLDLLPYLLCLPGRMLEVFPVHCKLP